jgi:hypothetical protein
MGIHHSADVGEGFFARENIVNRGAGLLGFRAQMQGSMALRVQIHYAHPFAQIRQTRGQIHAGGRLSHTAFLIHHRNCAHRSENPFPQPAQETAKPRQYSQEQILHKGQISSEIDACTPAFARRRWYGEMQPEKLGDLRY